jgi:hypothetical protein
MIYLRPYLGCNSQQIPGVNTRKPTFFRDALGDNARNSVPVPRIVLHQEALLKSPPHLALLPRFCGVLARSNKSAGSCVFRVYTRG